MTFIKTRGKLEKMNRRGLIFTENMPTTPGIYAHHIDGITELVSINNDLSVFAFDILGTEGYIGKSIDDLEPIGGLWCKLK